MDLSIVILYFVVTLIIAFKRSKKGGYKEYFFCKGQYSLTSLTATMFATAVGAASIFYVAEIFYKEGVKSFFVISGNYISQFLVSIFVVSKMKRWLGHLTPGEIISDIYSFKLRKSCGIAAAMVSVGFVAVQIYAFGYVIAFFYDVPEHYSIIIGGLFTILYTAYGGINSVIKTDIFQFCIICASIFLLTKISVNKVGGLDHILSSENSFKSPFVFNKQDAILFLKCALIGFNPSFIQRVFIAKDIKQARDATLLYNFLVIGFYILIGICGITACMLFPGIDPKKSIAALVNHIAPIGMKGLLVAGFLASIMSSADSDLNIAGVSVYKDVLGYKISVAGLPIIKKISVVLGIFAIIIALNFDSIVDILFFVINFWSVTFMFPLIFGIMGLRLSYRAIVSVLCISICAAVLYELFAGVYSWIGSGLIGTMVNACTLLLCYFMKKWRSKKMAFQKEKWAGVQIPS